MLPVSKYCLGTGENQPKSLTESWVVVNMVVVNRLFMYLSFPSRGCVYVLKFPKYRDPLTAFSGLRKAFGRPVHFTQN